MKRPVKIMGGMVAAVALPVLFWWAGPGPALAAIGGLVLVAGGTLAATSVSRSYAEVRRILREIPALLQDDVSTASGDVAVLLRVAECYRAHNIYGAEQALAQMTNPFLRKGAQLVIDRATQQELVGALKWELDEYRAQEKNDVQLLRTMATFAPVFGMLGTLVGLIALLGDLGQAGLGEVGSQMAFALLTTLYGLIAANLMFKPLAMKLEKRAEQRLRMMQRLFEVTLLLHERAHPSFIAETLRPLTRPDRPAAAPLAVVAARS